MKTIILIMLLGGVANAGEFKLIDVHNPSIVTGVFDDLKGHKDAGASLALITNTGIPNFTPLAIGGSLGASLGGPSVSIGMSVNLLPSIKAGALSVLNAIWPNPNKFSNVKTIFWPSVPSSTDIVMSCGPHWSFVFVDGIKTKGMLTLFYGAEWHF